jgi:hypothetical protein
MEASMADQATSVGGRSAIGPHPETPAAGAPASASAPADPAAAASTDELAAAVPQTADERAAGFGERGRMRRRLRFLRKARELAYRDLGGLVFEMQRLGERRDELVTAKLATLAAIDTELRALEDALGSHRTLTILRESGIAACPRCAAIHGSEDRFCPSCGLAMESRADRPIAAVAAPAAVPAGGAGIPGVSGVTPVSATPAATAAPLFAPPPPRPAGPATSSPVPATASPASAPPSAAPPRTPPAPLPRTPPAAPPGPPAPPTAAPQVTDERPTEIIRPADGSSSKDA